MFKSMYQQTYVAPSDVVSAEEAAIVPTEVRITNIDIPFGSMVNLILKFTLATIPAAILLAMVGAVFALALGIGGEILK